MSMLSPAPPAYPSHRSACGALHAKHYRVAAGPGTPFWIIPSGPAACQWYNCRPLRDIGRTWEKRTRYSGCLGPASRNASRSGSAKRPCAAH